MGKKRLKLIIPIAPLSDTMIIAAHQPNFMPNLAFFNKMQLSDEFVIISNIQFEKQEGWQQRHKIPGPQNDIWITVPVLGSQNQLIKDVKINNNSNWKKKHLRTFELLYGKSKGKDYLSALFKLYEKEWNLLADFNSAIIIYLKNTLDIKTPVSIDREVSGTKHTLLINVCKKYNADTYLSGYGARSYLTDERMKEINTNGIKHEYVVKNLTAEYPYSTIHYLLSEGKEWVVDKIS